MKLWVCLLSIMTWVTVIPQGNFAHAQNTAERITLFESLVTINEDASLTVTETISVIAQGQEIKRGIYRDFPTDYRDNRGNRIRVGFEVLEVKRNGATEEYKVETISGGKRVRIGNANRFLTQGAHTYTITYRTTRQLGFFDDFDELYWNVTGNGWGFVIDKARARVYLPQGARTIQYDAYTGSQGAQGKDFQIVQSYSPVTIETTRPLNPGEGLTIAVAWPKGFVPEPTDAERAQYFFQDNLGTSLALFGGLGVLGYYMLMWSRFGRDPEKGTIIPRFKPPDNLSPAATRFIWKMGYDDKTFASALVNMAVKGALTISEEGKNLSLEHRDGERTARLSRGEEKIEAAYFSGKYKGTSLTLKKKKHAVIRKGIDKLKDTLKNEYEVAYFNRNSKLFYIGLGISIVSVIVAAFFASDDPSALFLCLWLSGWTVGCTFLVFMVWNAWKSVASGGGAASTGGAIFISLFALPFFTGEIVVLGILSTMVGLTFMAVIVAIGGMNALFHHLLKAPTRAGRAVLDEIDGFRMYLSAAEEDRLNMMTGERKTPELFERYLPYAIALDLENEWAAQFSSILSSAASAPSSSSGYHPRWYRGRRWNTMSAQNFAGNLSSNLASTISSSSTAPGSRSGSGGGGSSGGGGGGGGGGGW